jgi:AcrR family transcriptional regulator
MDADRDTGAPGGVPAAGEPRSEAFSRPEPAREARTRDPGARRTKLRADDGRLVRGRRSRDRIREAATALFRERGFDGATLREIARRAGMGASSIYRHVASKEELLVDELARLQEDTWLRFRKQDDRDAPTRERVHRFLVTQHELYVEDRDFTTIALRAITKPDQRVARDVLLLQDRTVGLVMEILQMGRMRNRDLAKSVDVMEAARVIFHVTQGARIPWAHGLLADEACLDAIQRGVDLVFGGIGAAAPATPRVAAPSGLAPPPE